ncbi:creatininase family protein [Paenibacillus wynnii]|uniref:creatininase family protein n=1 Tax=Paenibacillus wynnii TaxID=268407 RepID=UPI000A914E0F|nr:creatininase family protein [Paenibacillus wynnii]
MQYVLPTFPFNTSEEHANFKGTVTVSPNILTTMLEEIIVNLTRQGFVKFVICNGHGGAYWESAFIKHMNFKYPDIILIHPHHNRTAWDIAVKSAGLEGINELHGGLLSVCTAMWLCPDKVKLQSMGSEIPEKNILYSDFLGWDKLTSDGCWGQFTIGKFTEEELSRKGKIFWETFIKTKCEGLKEILIEAYLKKIER